MYKIIKYINIYIEEIKLNAEDLLVENEDISL